MAEQLAPPPVRYITEEDGRRVGVVLNWEDYARLQAQAVADPDLLAGLSRAEVEALAHSKLAPERQERLAELQKRLELNALTDEEREELDRLLAQVDQLNILKARALLTLQEHSEKTNP